MHGSALLTPAQVAAASHNLAQAKASLACEGMYLTLEEEALFARFDEMRLPHDECRRQLLAYCRAKRDAKARAAK